MHAALDEGITFFDNAWDYHDGHSEEARSRAKGVAAKSDRADLTFSCKAIMDPAALTDSIQRKARRPTVIVKAEKKPKEEKKPEEGEKKTEDEKKADVDGTDVSHAGLLVEVGGTEEAIVSTGIAGFNQGVGHEAGDAEAGETEARGDDGIGHGAGADFLGTDQVRPQDAPGQ